MPLPWPALGVCLALVLAMGHATVGGAQGFDHVTYPDPPRESPAPAARPHWPAVPASGPSDPAVPASGPSDPAVPASDPSDPAVPASGPADPAGPPGLATWSAPGALDPRRPAVGELMIAVESVECRVDGGAQVLMFVGPALEVGAERAAMTLEKRFAARYSPAEAGVDPSDWWCVPRRRYCYGEVDFSDWRGTHGAGQSFALPSADAFHIDWGVERTLRAAVARACPK